MGDREGIVGDSYHWRGMLLPVVSFEHIYNPDYPQPDRRQKMVAILHTQLGLKQMPYFALAVEGIPRLAPVNKESVEHLDDSAEAIEALHESILANVKYRERDLLIPDIKTVEWLIEQPGDRPLLLLLPYQLWQHVRRVSA